MTNNVDIIKKIALECGFDDCRIATARKASHADEFQSWLDDGCHGEMAWMERTPERRTDPRLVLSGCKSIICLALNYFPGLSPNNEYRIARYSWNEDYHDIIEKMLRQMDEQMKALGGIQRFYVDTGPVLERDFASDAGLGWNGKSTVQIHRHLGTWTFLCELLTTLDLEADRPFGDHCGKCTRCIDACPTQAITEPHRVDARRCISYLTIENKGPIPVEFRRAIGNRLYGCDACLEICPWNKHAKVSREARFHARESIFQHSLRDFLKLDVEAFRNLFSKSPIKRIKLPRFLRNVCVVLGNTGTTEDLPSLREAAQSEDPLIQEHAEWAILEIEARNTNPYKILPMLLPILSIIFALTFAKTARVKGYLQRSIWIYPLVIGGVFSLVSLILGLVVSKWAHDPNSDLQKAYPFIPETLGLIFFFILISRAWKQLKALPNREL